MCVRVVNVDKSALVTDVESYMFVWVTDVDINAHLGNRNFRSKCRKKQASSS